MHLHMWWQGETDNVLSSPCSEVDGNGMDETSLGKLSK